MPRKWLNERVEIHYQLNIPRGDPGGMLRGSNMMTIRDNMIAEAEVNAAFEDLKLALARGEDVGVRYKKHAKKPRDSELWVLFSSQYLLNQLSDIDTRDFHYEFDEKMYMIIDATGMTWGGSIEFDERNYTTDKLRAPRYASFEPVEFGTGRVWHLGFVYVWGEDVVRG